MVLPAVILAESAFEGRVGFSVESQRKKCTSCVPTEFDNEIEVTVLDLMLRPKAREDLSFGLKLEFDTESEGAILGSGRTEIENNNGFGLWIRKDFDNGVWVRAQASAESDDRLLDLGGRIGYDTELTENLEFSSYTDIERRFPLGSSSTANEGTYVEAGAELSWDWDSHGAWTEFRAAQWFFDSSAVSDEREYIFQPGFWVALGESGHRGLAWAEFSRFRATGARPSDEYSSEVGLGVEFELPKRSELMVGATIGRELEKRPGRADERATIYGIEFSFQRRF